MGNEADNDPADGNELARLQLYARFVRQQCQFVVMGVDGLHAALQKGAAAGQVRRSARREPPDEDDWDMKMRAFAMLEESERELWFFAQSLLSAAANVDKALWGRTKDPAHALSRQPLREALRTDDGSPMKGVRRTRNHFDLVAAMRKAQR